MRVNDPGSCNTLQMEKQERQAKKAKEENKTDTDLDGLINVE